MSTASPASSDGATCAPASRAPRTSRGEDGARLYVDGTAYSVILLAGFGGGVVIRSCSEADVPIVREIYAAHIEGPARALACEQLCVPVQVWVTGLASFEEEVPALEEMERRRAAIQVANGSVQLLF
jgi:hypothetical protein